MIDTTLDMMRPAEAYQLGYTDCLHEHDLAAAGAAERAIALHTTRLDALLDRIDHIEPTPHMDADNAQAPARPMGIYDQEVDA
jgi:hypothetical protein